MRSNASPAKVERPKFEHYSDINSFRSNSPRAAVSPLWRVKRTGSIVSNLSGKSSPKPALALNLQVVRTEELRKAIQVINEMNDEEISRVPKEYAQELYEFCKVVRDRIKS
jgi:hypothetical protein